MNGFRFTLLLVVFAAFAAFASGYVIDGDCIVYENEYGRLSQCPHTLTGFRNYAEIAATSYFNETQDLDFALGFDTSQAKPRQAWFWKLDASHQVRVACNVSHSLTCGSTNFSYTLDPNFAWCYNDSGGNSSLMWEHDFVNGWIGNQTIEWFEQERACLETQYWPDWQPLQTFSTVEYAGKTWYVVSASFENNETKLLRTQIDAQPFSSGKYDLAIKRSEDSWADAFASGHYVLLDPWWNVSWNNRKPINVSEVNGVERFMEAFSINLTGLSLAADNCTKEIRITAEYTGGETEIDFMVVNNSGQLEGSGKDWCVIMFLVNMTTAKNATYTRKNVTNYYAYYGNVGAVDPGYSNLNVWNLSYHGDVNPIDDGWTLQALECNSNYSYVNSGNMVWNANDTDASGRCRQQQTTDHVPGNLFTVEVRYKAISQTGDLKAIFGGRETQAVYLEINSTAAGVGDNGEAAGAVGRYNYINMDTTSDFHVYRLQVDNVGNLYSLYIDGALTVTGVNASTLATSVWKVMMGEDANAVADSWNGEIDFFALHPSMLYSPLTGALGAEETSGSAPSQNNTFFMNCSDELTETAISFNASIFNATNTTSYSNADNVSFNISILSGFLTALVNRTDYYPRTYYPVIDGTVNVTLKCYLLPTSASVALVQFYVQSTGGVAVSGANISVSRQISGSWVVVAQGQTDSAGGAIFYLEVGTSYRVDVTATGYASHSSTITASTTSYTITLVSGAGYANFTSVWGGISYAFKPWWSLLYSNETLGFTVAANNSDMEFSGWNLTWQGISLNYTNYTNNNGSTSEFNFSVNFTGNVTGYAFFKRSGFPTIFINRTWFIANYTADNATMAGGVDYLADRDDIQLGLGLIALLFTTVLSGWVVRYGGASGAGIVALIFLAFFTFIGFISWQVFLLAGLASIGLALIMKGV